MCSMGLSFRPFEGALYGHQLPMAPSPWFSHRVMPAPPSTWPTLHTLVLSGKVARLHLGWLFLSYNTPLTTRLGQSLYFAAMVKSPRRLDCAHREAVIGCTLSQPWRGFEALALESAAVCSSNSPEARSTDAAAVAAARSLEPSDGRKCSVTAPWLSAR